MRYIGRALLCALLLLSAPALADDVSNGSWNTTDNSNNASPPNGWPAGMFPNQVEPAARADKGGVKRWWERANAGISTTGSAGAYVLTPTNTSFPTAYTQGEVYCAKANFTSVGNDTLNVNSLGAKPLYVSNGVTIGQIGAGQILNGQQFCVSYDGALNSSAGGFEIVNGIAEQTGTWTPTDVSGGGLTFSSVSASYTRIGNIVFASFSFVYPSTSDGNIPTIGGLPFTVPNAGYANVGGVMSQGITSPGHPIIALTVANTSSFYIMNGSTYQYETNAQLSTAVVTGMIIYPVH